MKQYFLLLILLISTSTEKSSEKSDPYSFVKKHDVRRKAHDFQHSYDIRYKSYFGGEGDFATRIIGGSKISVTEAPYHVSLQWYNFHFCGGCLYSQNIVVTAAHCVINKNTDDIFVRAGSSKANDGGTLYAVIDIVVHKQYNRTVSSHDIAVLRLEECITMSDRVKPIELARIEPHVNEPVLVTGFGRTEREQLNEHLMAVSVNIIDRKRCTNIFGKKFISYVNICAASIKKDACQGYSGGPLVYKNKLVGVVSWGKGCAHPNYPGVYSNIPALRGWIKHVVKNLTH